MTTTISRSYSPVLSVKADQKTIVSQLFRSLKSGKVCRVCFFVNGDKHFHGLHYVVNVDRIRTLDTLCAELSRLLVTVVSLLLSSINGIFFSFIEQLKATHFCLIVCVANDVWVDWKINFFPLIDLVLFQLTKICFSSNF